MMDEWARLQREAALRVVIEEMWKEIPRFVASGPCRIVNSKCAVYVNCIRQALNYFKSG